MHDMRSRPIRVVSRYRAGKKKTLCDLCVLERPEGMGERKNISKGLGSGSGS
jgi:hypothetical protein